MINKNKKSIISLNTKIEKCTICNRLVDFRTSIAKIKRKMYRKENYWGKPIVGFGDKNAKLMILGLAPAAHGGNRTGRVFTGDKSSDFLFMCLHAAGISNHSYSNYREDGLVLFNTYLTLALKCVPPGDKPTREELHNCSYFLKNEMDIINNIKVILCLGKIAFDSILQYYKRSNLIELKSFKFSHGAEYLLPDGKILVGCYHPSPRNVNTKRINKEKLVTLLKKVLTKLK